MNGRRMVVPIGVAVILTLSSSILAADPRPSLPAAVLPSTVDPAKQAWDLNEGIERMHVWSTYAADDALRTYRATLPETLQHRMVVMTMDETFRFDSPNASASTAVQGLIERRLDAAAYEMEHTTVTQNAVVWKLYDHGLVVRTSGFTVAFDMVRGWVANDPEVNTLTSRIVSQCDALFVSNKYAEHADTWVRDAFLSQSKPVIAPASVYSGDGRITRLARDGVTLHTVTMPGGRSLQVIMYPGRCGSDENNIPLIVAPGGLKFGHAGDQDNAGDFAWIDVIKNSHDVALLMVNTAPAQCDRLVKGFDPRVALTGHENDMSLNTTSRLGYFHSHDRLRQAGYPLTVMAWGDSFYYDPAQTASAASPIIPNKSAMTTAVTDPRPTLPVPPALSVVDPNQTYDWTSYRERQHEYAYHAADSLLRVVRPTYPELPERRAAMLAIDEALHWTNSGGSAMSQFYNRRIEAALYEMDHTTITQGAVVWKLYNHGFIARTASVTVAFDLIGAYTSHETLTQFINRCDILFISHWHSDHYENWITSAFQAQGKPVITPHGLTPDGTTLHTVNLSGGRQLHVVMYPGYQGDVPVSVPIIFTPENISSSHTGDLFQSNDTPIRMWDWIDYVKDHWQVDVLMVNNWAPDLQRVVRGFDPQVVIPGHENEIGHAVEDRKPWFMDYDRVRGMSYPSIIMTWGESYFFSGGPVVNYTPTIVANTISSTTLLADNATQYTATLTASDTNGVGDIADMRIMVHNGGSLVSDNARGYLVWGLTDADITHFGGTWTIVGDAIGSGRWGWYNGGWGSNTYITPVSASTTTNGNQRTVTWTFKAKAAWAPASNQKLRGFARDGSDTNTNWVESSANYQVLADNAPMIVSNAISHTVLIANNPTPYAVTLKASDADGVADLRDMRILLDNGGQYSAANGRANLAWGLTDADITHYGGQWTMMGDATGGGRWAWRLNDWGSNTYITPVSAAMSAADNERTVAFAFIPKTTWASAYNQGLRGWARDSLDSNTAWVQAPGRYNVLKTIGDFNNDGDVDQEDFGHLQACVAGSGVEITDPACLDARLDADIDIDADDVAQFVLCLSGPSVAVGPSCLR